MGRKISFRGQLATGLEDRIKLSTLNGKTGYRIKKFQTIAATPGASEYEIITQIFTKRQGSGSTDINFTDSDLVGVCYIEDNPSSHSPMSESIIFDNQIFNQDIFVNQDATVGTVPVNYYIELETIKLSDTQAAQLTLKNLRAVYSATF